MRHCKICDSNDLNQLLDYGPQPICNRFLAQASDPEARFPLGMNQCSACGLLQLTQTIPPAELAPRYDWITYNEPEGHLDRMVEEILKVCDLTPDATICGLSYKDASTLNRLKNKGFINTFMINPLSDLGITRPGAGIETIQDCFDESHAGAIAAQRGKADLIIARHILEHAHDLRQFTLALKTLLKPEGRLVLETPDFSTALEHYDYSTIWEEHSVYFPPFTFHSAVIRMGFTPLGLLNYPYMLENSLVAITRFDNSGAWSSAKKNTA